MLESFVARAKRVAERINASPTPYHAVNCAMQHLVGAGGRVPQSATDAAAPGLWYQPKGGTLIAWCVGEHHDARSGLRIVGAHTDSPNLRIKPVPARSNAGYRQLGVEVYGGVLLNSWMDRDLAVAGRLAVRDASCQGAARSVLVRVDEPLLRIPQLAIHLNRDVNTKGLIVNPQQHLSAIWDVCPSGSGCGEPDAFMNIVAEAARVQAHDILGHDLMLFDTQPARLVGNDGSLLSSARIDNLLSCFSAIEALATLSESQTGPGSHIAAVCLFDHEEVGSISATGAASPTLQYLLDTLATGFDASIDDRAAVRNDSLVLSADGAHGTHPNYPEYHDPEHVVVLNGGPVLKHNAAQRYATDALSAAAFRLACERAGAPMQHFVNRSDLPCGSTIGPVTASRLGISTVDAGCAMLAMHSVRELCGSHDIAWFEAVIEQFLLG